MNTKSFRILALLLFVIGSAACGGGETKDDQSIAVAVALTQTATALTVAPATPTPAPRPTTAWQHYANPDVGLELDYPAHWQLAAFPPANGGLIQGVTLSGPEGSIELLWGEGFGGACPPGYQPITVAQGTLDSCYSQAADGTESWEQISKQLATVSFSASAKTLTKDPASRALILASLATLSFTETNSASSNTNSANAASPKPATRPIVVRLDPAQSPPSRVAIYAEIPGAGPHVLGESYFMAEGAGTDSFTLQLPAAGYLIYGYSLQEEDISYFGAWAAEGGLIFIDGAVTNEVVLQRPLDPCNANYQLYGSPDGRFQSTDNADFKQRFGCSATNAPAASAPAVVAVAGPGESNLNIPMDDNSALVYLQLDAEEAPGDPDTSDLWLYVQDGKDYFHAVNGAKALPVAADMTLADCGQPSPQLFSGDAIPQGLQPGKAYCVYTNGSRLALVKITNRTDIVPKQGSSNTQSLAAITVVVEATEKAGASSTTASSTTEATTRSIRVHIDPSQSPPSAVAIYAEIPGVGPFTLGESYFVVEGDGNTVLQLDLPPAGYLIYGYSLQAEDISYFGAWDAASGLAFIDTATTTEVTLNRPANPCDANQQLHGSPDGRFPATDNADWRVRFGC